MTNYLLFLAIVAAAVHVVLGAMQSNTFNAMIAKFSIPALPAAAVPYLGVVLGIAATSVQSLQAGDTLSTAALKGVYGLLLGGGSALHLESLRKVPANDNGSGKSDKAPDPDATKPPPAVAA